MIPGPIRFAHFAYPPNALGYCGPGEHRELLELGAAPPGEALADGGLRALARGFEGAWPYLELIAAANGIADPLDDRVVEAYWIGNQLLDRVPVAMLGPAIETRFRSPAATSWEHLAAEVEVGARPHHQFHVFAVYPWVGLLRRGHDVAALHVLDRCRIRWGRVVAIGPGEVVVRSRPLVWEGRRLALGGPREEPAIAADDGYSFISGLRAGDWVALHWDWVCEGLGPRELRALRGATADALDLVNRRAPRCAPAAVLS
jgi:hypothetical protein